MGFSPRNADDYFLLNINESLTGWRKKWLYLKDSTEEGSAGEAVEFQDVIPPPKRAWKNYLAASEKEDARALFDQLRASPTDALF